MLKLILGLVSKLVTIAADLAAGKISEDEARAECIATGIRVTETDSDSELAEHEKIANLPGAPEPPASER